MQGTLAVQPEAATTTQSAPEEQRSSNLIKSQTIATSAFVNLKI